MKKSSLFIMTICYLFFSNASANAEGDRPINEIYKKSVAIIEANVVEIVSKCTGDVLFCNSEYILHFDNIKFLKKSESIKIDKSIKICTTVRIDIGSKYILFLEKPDKFNSQSAECVYAIYKDGVFEDQAGDMYRVGSPFSRILVDFEGHTYRTDAVLEPDFDKIIRSSPMN